MGEPNHCYLRDIGLQFMAFHSTGLFLYSLKHQKTRGYERSRGRHWKCSIRKGILKISHNSQENTCARVTFLLKKRLWHRCFPVEIFKNIFFIEHLRATASQETSGIVCVNSYNTFFQASLGTQKITVFQTISLFTFITNNIKLPSF